MKIPILILAFNRADHVIEAMKPIRDYRPNKIYLACDGARTNKVGEYEAVLETRKVMLDSVDWPCEINTLFRENNLGCAKAVYEAITWFFENEEYGIICEDDIIIHPDSFKLCEEYLPKYQNEPKIMMICAHNPIPKYSQPDKLCIMNINLIWGWATWRRAWEKMDMALCKWPTISKWKLVKEWGLFRGGLQIFRWNSVHKHPESCSSWATRWSYSIFANGGLNLYANVNLMKNIGLSEGTHFTKYDRNPCIYLKFGSIKWPVVPPKVFEMNRSAFLRLEFEFIKSRYYALLKRIHKLYGNHFK